MKSKLPLLLLIPLLLTGCTRYTPIAGVESLDSPQPTSPPIPIQAPSPADSDSPQESPLPIQIQSEPLTPSIPPRTPVKVKGIYVSAYVAGTSDIMEEIIHHVDETEINAVVLDFKDDEGRITCRTSSPVIDEIEACKPYVGDMPGLIEKLHQRGIYVIARVVAFKDPYLAEKKPEWSLKTKDGKLYRDAKDLAWVNPYRQEVWDYLVEVGSQAALLGFDEVQFDYIRFSTDKTMNQVAFSQEDTKGRSKTDIITEFTDYAYEQLAPKGIFVSADVFGAIIGSEEDAGSVGQIYADMAANLDYICPMIYPSHYGDGNFGLDHPDLHPYETILEALKGSKEDLQLLPQEATLQQSSSKVIVRPWLQDFTASYLKHHIKYGPEQVRQQIQAVYDAGYDEWILWSATNRYSWDGLLKEETSVSAPAQE